MDDIRKHLNISARVFWAAVLMAVAGAVIYSPSFNSPFQFDDNGYILNNPAIRSVSELPSLWERLDYRKRFVGFFSFAVNYWVHGENVFGYHIVNLAIHVAAAWAVWWFVSLLLAHPGIRGPAADRSPGLLPFSAALLFLTHPVQTQAVTYISQRFTSLSALFYLIALCLYISGRLAARGGAGGKGAVFLTGAFLSGILAIFTKETALTLPVVLFLYEWYTRRRNAPGPGPSRRTVWLIIGILTVILLFLLMSAYIIEAPRQLIRSRANIAPDTYLFTQFQGFFTYARLLLLPITQNLKYDHPLSYSFWEPLTVLGALGVAALGVVAFKIRRQNPLASFSILWIFVQIALESSIIPIRDVINEHRLYLPSVGFCVLLGMGMTALARTKGRSVALLALVVLVYSGLTYQRNVVWGSGISLWGDVVNKSPEDVTGHINLASEYSRNGELPAAILHLEKAAQIYERRRAERFRRMESLLAAQRGPAALVELEEYIFLGQQQGSLHRICGDLNHSMGRAREAQENVQRAESLRLQSEALSLYAAGLKALNKGDVPGAREHLAKAREIMPVPGDSLSQYLENAISAANSSAQEE